MIHSNIEKAKTAKGTNWEQKFQKPQNENICLINLNVANKRNFPILASGELFQIDYIKQFANREMIITDCTLRVKESFQSQNRYKNINSKNRFSLFRKLLIPLRCRLSSLT